MRTLSPIQNVVLFLVLLVLIRGPFYIASIVGGWGNASRDVPIAMIVLAVVSAPPLLAVAIKLATQRSIRGFGWKLGPVRFLIAGWAAPIVLASVVYGIGLWGGALTPAPQHAKGLLALIEQTVGITLGLAIPTLLFEELGWRGFLVPELAKFMSFGSVALVSGAVWALFHYPFLLAPAYATVTPTVGSVVAFTLAIVAASFPLAWLRLRSGSIWPAVLFHAAHNAFVNDVLGKQLHATGRVNAEFFGESGFGLAIAYSLLAVWCWRHRAALPAPQEASGQARARVGAYVSATMVNTVRVIQSWYSPLTVRLTVKKLRSAVVSRPGVGALLLLIALPHLALMFANPASPNWEANFLLAAMAVCGGWMVSGKKRGASVEIRSV